MISRVLDWGLILLFAFACFIALYYEPAFFLQCGWDGLHAGSGGVCSQTWVGRAWLGYLKVEPLYANAPIWIRLVNEFDTVLFGWFYLLSVVVFVVGRQDRLWYRLIATFVAGMMTYSIALYLTWEALSYRDTGADLSAVMTYNGLWAFIFALLLLRLNVFPRRSATAVAPYPPPAGRFERA